MFEGQNGLFSLLRDECSLAKSQATNYIQKLYLYRKTDLSLESPRPKSCKSDELFTVKHYARSVCYSTVSVGTSENYMIYEEFIYVLF